jgi:hypothetical protein
MSKTPSFVANSSQKGSSGVAASSATTPSASAAISAPIQRGNFLTVCEPVASIGSKSMRRAALKRLAATQRSDDCRLLSAEVLQQLNGLKDRLYTEHFDVLLGCRRGIEDRVYTEVEAFVAVFAEAEHLAGHMSPSALTLLKMFTPVTEFLSETQQQRLFHNLMSLFPAASLDQVNQGIDASDQFGRLMFRVLTSVQPRRAVFQCQGLFFDMLRHDPSLLVDNWSILTKSMKNEMFARMVMEGIVRVRAVHTNYFNDWMSVLHQVYEVDFGSRLHPVFVRCLQTERQLQDVLLFTSDPRALIRGGFKRNQSADCSICGCVSEDALHS